MYSRPSLEQPLLSGDGGSNRLTVLTRVSIDVKRHHGHSNSYKGKHLIEVVAYSFRGLVPYHHGEDHGGMQADMVL